MKKEITKELKVMWLSRMFYGVSHAFDLDINPYNEFSEFLESETRTLLWGTDKKDTKTRFSRKYHLLLDLYGIELPLKYIIEELDHENQLNKIAVEHWAEHSKFPPNW